MRGHRVTDLRDREQMRLFQELTSRFVPAAFFLPLCAIGLLGCGGSGGASRNEPSATPSGVLRTYFFGHSLVNHTAPPAGPNQNIPTYLAALSEASGVTYSNDVQF